VGTVLLDFSAAFDIIDHNVLFSKRMCMVLHPLPYHGLRAIYPIEHRVFFNRNFSNVKHVEGGITQGSSLGPLLFSIFTNDLPLALNKARVSMYSDDSTLYTSATTASEITETLNKELQSVLEWVASNKQILNIFKSIEYGTNHSLNSKPQLNLVMNGVAVEQLRRINFLMSP
jgi:hypothetical protein